MEGVQEDFFWKKTKQMSYDDDDDLPILPISSRPIKTSKRVSKRAYRRYLNNMVTFSELEEIYD